MSARPGGARGGPSLALWTVVCGLAELLGIATGALWWVGWDQLNPEPVGAATKAGMLAIKGLSGLVEGLILGLAQAWLLRRRYTALSAVAWSSVTCALALLGWTIGSSFAIYGGAEAGAPPADPGPVATVIMSAGFGLAVGAVFGAGQALVLRRAARRAWVWIAANAAGWAIALPAIYLAASVGGGPGLLPLAAGSGLAAGLMLGLVTGLSLRWMPPRETDP